jgi:hypothetical protein
VISVNTFKEEAWTPEYDKVFVEPGGRIDRLYIIRETQFSLFVLSFDSPKCR